MIFTQKYRSFLASQLRASIVSGNTAPYIWVGRVLPWVDAANVAVSDSNPPAPVDHVQNTDYEFWRDLLVAKLVTANNIQLVVPRRDWVTGTIYDQYDDLDADLPTKTYYVLDSTQTPFKLYKCCWNNLGAASTVAPSTIGTPLVPTTAGDSYVWQYMYTIPDDNQNRRFLTSKWMPVLANSVVQANALTNSGKLPIAVPFVVTTPGAGYNPANAVSVTLSGDGASASVSANGVTIIGGHITEVRLALGGLGYSQVTAINVFQSGATTQATARAIIPPYPNHGYDPVKELNATALMFVSSLDSTETGNLTVINNYRRVGLILNPLLKGTTTVANATLYRQTTNLTISANTGVLLPDDIVTNITKASAPTATVVDVVTVANNYVVRLTGVNDNGDSVGFSPGDTVKNLSSGVEVTVATIEFPQLETFSGIITCVEQRKPVNRDPALNEEIKLVFPLK